MSRFSRCGPNPAVCTTRPIAPSRTRRNATVVAGTRNRSEKQIEKMRPVSATACCRSVRSAAVVTPGLSISTSLPCRIAWIASVARSAGTAAHTMSAAVRSSSSAALSSTSFKPGNRLRNPATTPGSEVLGPPARAVRPGRQQPAHQVPDMAVIEPDGHEPDGHLARFEPTCSSQRRNAATSRSGVSGVSTGRSAIQWAYCGRP